MNDVVVNDTSQSHHPNLTWSPQNYSMQTKYTNVLLDITSIQGKKHANKIVNCMTQSSKIDVTAIRFNPGIQLLDYAIDGQPNDETLKTPKRPVEASEGFP